MSQRATFGTDGFVMHKVSLAGYKGHFSAWYDKDGRLTDAEQVFPGQRFGARNVKKSGPAWQLLAALGPSSVPKPANQGASK